MSNKHIPRFAGDIKPDVNDPDAEYVRLAKWLDKFLPKDDIEVFSVELSNSNDATYESVEVIQQLISQGKKDYIIRRFAEEITRYLPEKDYKKEVAAVYNFVVRRLRYTKDIHKVETVHRARELLSIHLKAADCDDFVILTGALLQAIGHPVRIVIIGSNKHDKEDYSHIYLQTSVNNKWISLDGSVPGAKMGGEAPKYASKKIINFDGTSLTAREPSKILMWLAIAVGIYCFGKAVYK